MAQRRRRRSRHFSRIILADSDFTRINRPPSVLIWTNTKRLKNWRQPAGRLFQIILGKSFYSFSSSNNFRAIYGHSSIGLDDNSMLLLGGRIGDTYETGIWQIKEDIWSRVGELTQVSNLIILIFVISECRLWIGDLQWAFDLFFLRVSNFVPKSPDWFDGKRRDKRSHPNFESWKPVQLSRPISDYSRLLRLKSFIHCVPDLK